MSEFVLDDRTAAQLREMYRWYLAMRRRGGGMTGGGFDLMALGKVNGTITARSGSTPGTGTVQLQRLANGLIANQQTNELVTVEVTVKSFASTASANGAWVWIARNGTRDDEDVWWFVSEDCS